MAFILEFSSRLRMAIIIYFVRAFSLIRCCFSRSYRAMTLARWKKTPTHRLIYEIGTGVIGLAGMVAIIVVIVISSKH